MTASVVEHGAQIGLVGDIGGTNARFALASVDDHGALSLDTPESLATEDFRRLEDAIETYLQDRGHPALAFTAMACAGPVLNGRVEFTNLAWTADAEALHQRFNAAQTILLNDLEAVAWATPALKPEHLHRVGGPETRVQGATVAVLGAGTGVNASALQVDRHEQTQVWAGEFGHTSFAPVDELEVEIWRVLRGRFGRVSVERVISGPGILNLYQALCQIHGQDADCVTPPDVALRAEAGDATAQQALEHFALALGSIAGDVALSYGAKGGVFIAGGIAPTLLPILETGGFRRRFEDKGRFQDYLAETPSAVIIHPFAALLGAARAALATGAV